MPHITKIKLKLMKLSIPRILDKIFGNSLKQYYGLPTIESRLDNMCKLGFDPKFIIDIGAFNGEWTTMTRMIFPNAAFLMFEAQESKISVLDELKRIGNGKIDFRIVPMGPIDGEQVIFHVYDNSPTASSMLHDHARTPTRPVQMIARTLDSILAEDNRPWPDLIKLDVQGYELEVLKGAESALTHTEAVLMEVSIIELYQGNPILSDVIAFMAARGFRAYDICSLLRRPLDGALCQMDMIFIKESSRFLKYKVWS